MKKGQKYQRWRGLHIKKHPLKWFTDRMGECIIGACNKYHLQTLEQCELYFQLQTEIDARFTEYPKG
jgi:hypothetical protein